MKIQSLSVCVPVKKCINNCNFCVSRLHENNYLNQIEKNEDFHSLYQEDYLKRLRFAKDNNCNTIVLTGTGEPLQNIKFLENFAIWNKMLFSSFHWIELQTSGVLLSEENLKFLRQTVGVSTIALSVSDLLNDENNAEIMGISEKLRFNLDDICKKIKKYDFNLRLSINLLNQYDIETIFIYIKSLNVDQVVFRKMYYNQFESSEIDKWIMDNKCSDEYLSKLKNYIQECGEPINILPFGATQYSLDGLSVVLDDNCMSEDLNDTIRYLILRENCRLYFKWQDKSSLIF